MYLNELRQLTLKDSHLLTPRQLALFQKMGLETVFDVLNRYPFRYEDRSRPESISQSLTEGRPVAVVVQVVEHQQLFFNNRRHPKIIVQDESMRAALVGFNRDYLRKSLPVGGRFWLYAQFQYKYNEVQTFSFDFEEFHEDTAQKSFGRIMPVYPLTESLYQKELRALMQKVMTAYLPTLHDELPDYLLKQHHLTSKNEALSAIHFPKTMEDCQKAKLRLAFEEYFAIQLAVTLKRRNKEGMVKNRQYQVDAFQEFQTFLPYQMTNDQALAVKDIAADLANPHAMHRLIQGDVGSGKTTAAFAALYCAYKSGYQSALMVPTETLALQHAENWNRLFQSIGLKALVLTASSGAEKAEIYDTLVTQEPCVVIGTHALIQEKVKFGSLGLVIFDEQHKFGVEQRITLARKGDNPDLLVMTATPIPRTLTMTLYGDLDVSVIREMPAGRIAIKTKWVERADLISDAYLKLLSFIEKELDRGRQAYFVYPVIEEGKKADSAVKMADFLTKRFRNHKVGLMHGRLSAQDKQEIMSQFKENKIQILVSTTVIEVGIDVKNATVMVIEGADSFGLSQLHQLRGRVGRGEYASYCALITPKGVAEDTRYRMEAMVRTVDGFVIAEEDLKLRGPGEMLGSEQSGMPELKIKDYYQDERLLMTARQDALTLVGADPKLEKAVHESLLFGIIRFLPADYLYSG